MEKTWFVLLLTFITHFMVYHKEFVKTVVPPKQSGLRLSVSG